MRTKSIIRKTAKHSLERHKRKCKICNNKQRKEIEEDYMMCMPYVELRKKWNICYETFLTHAIKTGIWIQRDRKTFYWRIIENYDFSNIRAEHAIEAAKQLDRLEHKLDAGGSPTQINVIYSFGDKMRPKPQKSE